MFASRLFVQSTRRIRSEADLSLTVRLNKANLAMKKAMALAKQHPASAVSLNDIDSEKAASHFPVVSGSLISL